ncbi:D-alanyl-D-alanine carboxypeptidase family protein [Oscillospiraceae bacterium PP1C4]
MLKKTVTWLMAFLLLLLGVRITDAYAEDIPAAAQTIPNTQDYETNAKAAVVIDAQTGRVLFAQNANLHLPMASTTKIMTALLTLEQEGLDEYFTVDSAAIHVEGSSMGLREGDSVSLRALAFGMLLASGNDGANAAAVRIAGTYKKFAEMMNNRAAEIGMENTNFVTPSGLDDPQHYSTAYDMALLAREALLNSDFAGICSQSKAVMAYGSPPYNRWLTNHNRLLKTYEGTVGVKTGFTKAAGRCLVSCAQRGGDRLITVTLNCPDDWNVHANLYDRYFGLLSPTDIEHIIPKVEVPVAGGAQPKVAAHFDPPTQVSLMHGEGLSTSVTAAPFLYAPVVKGQVIGNVKVYCDNQHIAEVPLTAAENVAAFKQEKQSWVSWLFGWCS